MKPMSMAATFDTLKFVETLKASGFDETQAKGLAVAIRDVQATQLEDVADKRDLKELEGQLSTKADVARVEIQVSELRKEIAVAVATAKVETIRWVVATGIVILGGVAALYRLTPPPTPVYYQIPMQMSAPAPSAPTMAAPVARQIPPVTPVQPER